MHLNQKQIKEYLANPEAFAAAAAPTAVEVVDGGAAAQAPPAEPEEESDDDMVSVPPCSCSRSRSQSQSRSRVRFASRAVLRTFRRKACTDECPLSMFYNFHPSFSMGSNGTHSLDTPHRASISSAEQLSAAHLAFCVCHCHYRRHVAVSLSTLSSECQKYTHRCKFHSAPWPHITWRSQAAHRITRNTVR